MCNLLQKLLLLLLHQYTQEKTYCKIFVVVVIALILFKIYLSFFVNDFFFIFIFTSPKAADAAYISYTRCSESHCALRVRLGLGLTIT